MKLGNTVVIIHPEYARRRPERVEELTQENDCVMFCSEKPLVAKIEWPNPQVTMIGFGR